MKTTAMKKVRTAPAARCLEHGEGPNHDCAYVTWRDGLVAAAEKMADAEVPRRFDLGEDEWSRKWDLAYHAAMTRLTTDPFTGASAPMRDVFGGAVA